MANGLDKLKALNSRLEERQESTSYTIREENLKRITFLFNHLTISEKASFENLFLFKAMNLSGIGLKEETFGQIHKGKYIQIIAITYELNDEGKKRAKNVSLGYFGKAESIEQVLKNEIIEFVLRWRYEKAFQNVEHYKGLLSNLPNT